MPTSGSRASSAPATVAGGERTPPHDLLAEQSALGGMMLSNDAVADVTDIVRGVDFYLPKHEVIFEAILALYSHGEPTDVIAVTDELTKSGPSVVPAEQYLHTLTALVPTAANAGYYASIVAEKAVLRRLVEAAPASSDGPASEGEVTDLVNNAQAEIYAVTGRPSPRRLRPAGGSDRHRRRRDRVGPRRDGQLAGVPTGFAELDTLTNASTAGSSSSSALAPPWVSPRSRSTSLARRRVKQAAHDLLLARDGPQRDRDSTSLGRVEHPDARLRKGNMDERGLDEARERARRDRRCAAVHRRQPQHDALVEIRAKCRKLSQRWG